MYFVNQLDIYDRPIYDSHYDGRRTVKYSILLLLCAAVISLNIEAEIYRNPTHTNCLNQ
jgi:hypothetical protein